MAPESINFRRFTSCSDVWMLGMMAFISRITAVLVVSDVNYVLLDVHPQTAIIVIIIIIIIINAEIKVTLSQ